MATPTKMNWDGAADQKLLLAILAEHTITIDHEKVAAVLGCTGRAVLERLKKLKRMAAEKIDNNGSSTIRTPQKSPGKRAAVDDDEHRAAPKGKKGRNVTNRSLQTKRRGKAGKLGTSTDEIEAHKGAEECQASPDPEVEYPKEIYQRNADLGVEDGELLGEELV